MESLQLITVIVVVNIGVREEATTLPELGFAVAWQFLHSPQQQKLATAECRQKQRVQKDNSMNFNKGLQKQATVTNARESNSNNCSV